MRVPSQLVVGTSEAVTESLGYKRVILTAGDADVQVGFSYRLAKSRETDLITIPTTKRWKFTAPKGKKIWFVFYKAGGATTLDLVATDGDIDEVT